MKRVLFLLCACACLAATAAILPEKKANFHDVRLERVMKHQKFEDLFKTTVAPEPGGATYKQFMDGAKKSLQDKKVNRGNLVNKQAPRRLSNEDIISNPYVCFLYAYDYDFDSGEMVPADPFYAGSGAYWYPEVEDGYIFFAGFYWDKDGSTYYLPLDIDYNTGEVALPWGILIEDDSIIGTARNRTDTIWYKILVSEDYFEYAEENDCMGTLYEDGSIIFDDNYVYYVYKEERKYQNRILVNTEITEIATMYVGTEILAANGELSFNLEKNGSAGESPVYMFEDENYDLYVGNMWDYGMPYCKMSLTEDYKAIYECAEVIDGTTYLFNPILDIDDTLIDGGIGMFYPVSDYQLDDQGYVIDFTWGFEANGTPEQITWPYIMPSNGYHFLYGFKNNVLKYTNGDVFIFPSTVVIVRGDANKDGNIDIYDVITLVDHLRSGDFDDSDGFCGDNADADGNGGIDFADIDAIYDYLITGTWPEQL